jgi:hypothetical protein
MKAKAAAVKERGILYSAPMVRATLAPGDAAKTQTRRRMKNMQANGMEVIRPREQPPGWSMRGRSGVWGFYTHEEFLALCPYGRPGDRLWGRETWGMHRHFDFTDWYTGKVGPAREVDMLRACNELVYRADGEIAGAFWRPSILMPRWASRITLEITDVRVQRVQDISDEDIRAEGVTAEAVRALVGDDFVGLGAAGLGLSIDSLTPRELWKVGWSAINGADSWDRNDFVWALTFRRVEA